MHWVTNVYALSAVFVLTDEFLHFIKYLLLKIKQCHIYYFPIITLITLTTLITKITIITISSVASIFGSGGGGGKKKREKGGGGGGGGRSLRRSRIFEVLQ